MKLISSFLHNRNQNKETPVLALDFPCLKRELQIFLLDSNHNTNHPDLVLLSTLSHYVSSLL